MDISLGNRPVGDAYGAGAAGWGAADTGMYTVQRGDTLTRIARMHGVSLVELIAANPQIRNPNLIYADQRVNIPGGGAPSGASGASGGVAGAANAGIADGPLSRVQLAQVFHQAGFRGEALVSMVAIAMRESGGDPDAFNGDASTDDLSYGLTQINMLGKLGEARREQLGLESNDQLSDPLTNARAAYAISNQGRDLSPWGGYKGRSNTYNTDLGAAREAVQTAEREGLLGQSYTSASDGAAAGPMAASGAAAAPPAADMPVLRIGARGSAVEDLQRRLKAAGFDPGPIDGQFGPRTQAAVRAYQSSRGIVVDGWVGPQTWGKLLGGSYGENASAGGGAGAPVSGGAGVAPSAGAAPSGSIQAAIDFGMSHLGAPYVGGASPYRFGDRPGNGQTYQMQGQKAYVSPQGVIGFDCSGFVVAMYRHIGVDLGDMASSRAMKSQLPAISPSQLQPGDLIVKNGHVVVYIGNGKVLESSPSEGVRVNDASKFLSDPNYVCRRVPMG